MDFPELQVEAFLKDAFGEHPSPKYSASSAPPGQ
jgi:hypothetical protein